MPQLSTMEWDFKDQLHATQQQAVNNVIGEKTYYVYDPSGQRSRKITETANGTKKSERAYIRDFEIYQEYGANGAVSLARETLHVMENKQRIALVETRTQGNDGSLAQLIRYQYGNHLDSASLELDDRGQVISFEEYSPYGTTSYQGGPSAAETSLKRYRYVALERDEESGLNYHGARYYAPWLARWVACDPLGLVDGNHLYRIAHGNPVRFVDLTGSENTESTLVVPAMRKYLENAGIKYAEEVTFELLDKSGKVITEGRFDLVFRDPHGRLVIPELKGVNVNKLHGNQRIYSDQLTKEGGTIRFTSNKIADIGLAKGKPMDITWENYFRMGKMDLNDFEDALQQITGGKPIVGRYVGPGEYKAYTDREEYFKYLREVKGIEPVINRPGGGDPSIPPGRNPQRGSTNGEVMVTGAMTALAVWSAYQDSQYILEGEDATDKVGRTVEVTAGYGGMAAGAALGAKICAPGGPEAVLFCGLLGGAIGSGGARIIARGTWDAVKGLPDFIMPGPRKSINNDPGAIEFDARVAGNPVYTW